MGGIAVEDLVGVDDVHVDLPDGVAGVDGLLRHGLLVDVDRERAVAGVKNGGVRICRGDRVLSF